MQASKIRAKTIIDAALELIYPRSCRICGSGITAGNRFPLCKACYKEIRHNPNTFTRNLEKPEYYFDCARSVTVYEGIIRECIHKFKYNGVLSFETLFADLMINFAERHIEIHRFDLIIPVPLHKVKRRERSFNQAAILASSVSRRFKIPCADDNLIRIKSGRPQIDLSKNERLKDIRGAFKLRRPRLLKDKSVLLIDDVFTTGATVNECSKVLKDAGTKYIEVLTLAQGR